MSSTAITRLIGAMAAATGRAPSTISRLASGSGATYARLRGDANRKPPIPPADITTRRAARIVQWLSDHWPADRADLWPDDISRPAPSPGSPAAQPPAVPAMPAGDDPVAAVRAAKDRLMDGMLSGDAAARRSAERDMHAAGLQLGADGRIRSADALAMAFGVDRAAVDKAVSRFRDGRSRAMPRPGSDTERAFLALVAARDVRFRSRWEQAA